MPIKKVKKFVEIRGSIRYLYAKPDYTSDRVFCCKKGDRIEYVTKRADKAGKIWYQVNYGGKKLWIKSDGVLIGEH